AVLGDDRVELDHAVGRMGDDRHPQRVGGAPGLAEQVDAAGLDLPGRQEPARAAPGRSVDGANELQRRVELAPASRLVDDALESTIARIAHPAAAIVAGPEVAADPQT